MSNPYALLAGSSSDEDDKQESAGITRKRSLENDGSDEDEELTGPTHQSVSGKKRRKEQRRAQARQQQLTEQSLESRLSMKTLVAEGKHSHFSGRVSTCLELGKWGDALMLLGAMRICGQVPKLGALQRWVATLGDAASIEPKALALLDAMLRVAKGLGVSLLSHSEEKEEKEEKEEEIILSSSPPKNGTLVTFPDWEGTQTVHQRYSEERMACVARELAEVKLVNFRPLFRVIATIPGKQRAPPNRYDLNIYVSSHDAMGLLANTNNDTVKKVPVPFTPGAFMLCHVLSPVECHRIITAAETIGFVPDEPSDRTASLLAGTEAGLSNRAANFTWLADDSLQSSILDRCREFIPQTLPDGSQFTGLNARWRLYRYLPGAVYRPHVDGAWPGSGLVNGRYEYDAFGDRRSRFTFLIYLNEGFDGGCTTYFTPSPTTPGTVEARGVLPRTGSIMVFPHGQGAGSLVHEGSSLKSGTKYVIRSDLLYTCPPSGRSRQQQEKSTGWHGFS